MRDLPTGPALLALARRVLTEELLPLLPRERQLAARLAAAAMAIAERESISEAPAPEITAAIEQLFDEPLTPTLSPHRGEREGRSGGAEFGIVLRRFAQDLRAGAFEHDEKRGRAARAVMWRLTLAKLRLSNPRFLAANGFPA